MEQNVENAETREQNNKSEDNTPILNDGCSPKTAIFSNANDSCNKSRPNISTALDFNLEGNNEDGTKNDKEANEQTEKHK